MVFKFPTSDASVPPGKAVLLDYFYPLFGQCLKCIYLGCHRFMYYNVMRYYNT